METTTAPKVGGVYLADHINQNGITYGQRKLELMQKACRLQGTPLTDENTDQDGKGFNANAGERILNNTHRKEARGEALRPPLFALRNG